MLTILTRIFFFINCSVNHMFSSCITYSSLYGHVVENTRSKCSFFEWPICTSQIKIWFSIINSIARELGQSCVTRYFECPLAIQAQITPGIRILGTGSNTKNRVRQVTTTFSGEYAIFILSDRQRY